MDWRTACILILAFALFLLLMMGCVASQEVVTRGPVSAHGLAWIAEGRTTREEALLKLGLPASQFVSVHPDQAKHSRQANLTKGLIMTPL